MPFAFGFKVYLLVSEDSSLGLNLSLIMEKQKIPFLKRTWVQWCLAFSTLFGIGWGVYEHFYTRNPRVMFEIVSEAQLFNDSDRISSIHLYIDSLDIQSNNLNVRLYTIRISNKGRKHLSSSDYEGANFGLAIENGKLLDDTILSGSSNDYIKESFECFNDNLIDSVLLLPHVALDMDDWYEVSLALLYEKSILPVLKPIGKVLGQRTIPISKVAYGQSISFWDQLFFGSIWVQILRALIIIVLVFAFLLLLTITIEWIDSIIDKKRCVELANSISVDRSIPSFIRNDVIEKGVDSIFFAGRLLNQEGVDFNKEFDNSLDFISNPDNLSNPSFEMHRRNVVGIQELIKKGYLIKTVDGQLAMHDQVKDVVNGVYAKLKKYHLHPYLFLRNISSDSGVTKDNYFFGDWNS